VLFAILLFGQYKVNEQISNIFESVQLEICLTLTYDLKYIDFKKNKRW